MKVIQHFLDNSLRNFNYVICSEENSHAAFIDPLDISQTLPLCRKDNYIPKFLLNTHDHPDHIADNEKLLKNKSIKFITLNDSEELILSQSEKIRSLATPGHVLNHHCFLLIENNKEVALISGDTIFNSGIGHCRLGGDVAIYYETFKDIISKLDDNLILYPSHDYFETNLNFAKTVEPDNETIDQYLEKLKNDKEGYFNTTIGEEKRYNPFFRVFNSEFNKKFDLTQKELFIHLRKLRDQW